MDNVRPMEHLLPTPGESVADFRDRVAQRQADAAAHRQRELAEQTSEAHTPAARIKIWERLHQITMPRNPAHQVLQVIAASTHLTLEEVRAEQRQRAMPAIKLEP